MTVNGPILLDEADNVETDRKDPRERPIHPSVHSSCATKTVAHLTSRYHPSKQNTGVSGSSGGSPDGRQDRAGERTRVARESGLGFGPDQPGRTRKRHLPARRVNKRASLLRPTTILEYRLLPSLRTLTGLGLLLFWLEEYLRGYLTLTTAHRSRCD